MEGQEFVDFNEIRAFNKIVDIALLTTYLKEVFKDLADRAESNKKKGISKITFLDYIKLPVFIAEKLFNSLDQDNDTFLNSKEFIEGLGKLYLGTFEESVDLIFNIFDFDKDGVINKGDVKLLLSYLPLKTDRLKIEYKYQMQSLNEIDEILSYTFLNEKETMKVNEFIKVTECKKSDVYLQLLCFLYQKKPFNEENIKMLKGHYHRRKTAPELNENSYMSPQQTKRIPSPNRKSVFSPAESMLKINLKSALTHDPNVNSDDLHKFMLKKKSSFLDENTPTISGMKGMIRMPNEKIYKRGTENSADINNVIKNSKNVFNSPSTFLKVSKQASEFNLEENLIKMQEFSLDEESTENEGKIMHEDWIYKLSESLKIKKYWLVLIGKDIYYYKNEKKDEMLGMHNLSGCFVKENGEKKLADEKMYSISVIFTGKIRNYYCYDKSSALKWSNSLKQAIGYSNFFDFYEMLDDIGEGKFGLVKLGVHKKTKERVAIKIIKKESMQNAADVELVKSEIDIMKLCRHPNIVKLLDHFENAEYIFIVMEHLTGGDLGEYLTKNRFNVTEKRAGQIMFQIASGIKYLHQYGVLHRDLKPENIMLTEASDRGVIKVMDFGLSKIMGPDERVADGFGTLSFVAPEVLIRQPYGKQIDIWSLGVILYYMLSGTLPFDDENDNEEVIAKMTVFVEVQFPSKKWSKNSKEVIDIISKCLIKDPTNRITIDEFLNHPWILKHNAL
jgi:tRNA A-37 threonylcarbamoyl transferase component Bud32/Ca2+-binding EF-hand superfamily protein